MQTAPDSAPASDNRRRFDRGAVVWSGRLHAGDQDVECVILNVSPGGARVRVDNPVERAIPIALETDHIGGYLGEIVWQDDHDIGISFFAPPELVARRIGEALAPH